MNPLDKWSSSFVACAVVAAGLYGNVQGETSWNAVWNTTSRGGNIPTWSTAANWVDDYVGGTSPADNVNLAAAFETPESLGYGQIVALPNNTTVTINSITGLPKQVVGRAATSDTGNISVAHPDDFPGVWAQLGREDEYRPDPGEGGTANFRRVVNGWNPMFNVLSGCAVVHELYGAVGAFRVKGPGELALETPRNPNTRAILHEATTLTVKSPERGEPRIVTRGAQFHFDAAAADTLKTTGVEADGRNYVSAWHDAEGGVAYAYVKDENCRPFISPETANGLPLVDFGGYKGYRDDEAGYPVKYEPADAQERFGSAAYMLIGATNNASVYAYNQYNVCDAIVVAKAHAVYADSNRFRAILGAAVNGELGWGMLMSDLSMFNLSYSAFGSGGAGDHRIWLDGVPYFNYGSSSLPYLNYVGLWDPTNLHVFAFNLKSKLLPVTSLGSCRWTNGAEIGGVSIAEVIVYTNVLTDVERRETIEALKRKWMVGTASRDFDIGEVVSGSAQATLNVEEGDVAKLRTLRLAQNVAGSGRVVKKGAGRLEIEQILPRETPLAVEGGSVLFTHATETADPSRAKVPTDGAICWLDATAADCFVFDANNGINTWKDCRPGIDDVVATSSNKTGTDMPTAKVDATSGLTMMDFGSKPVGNDQPIATVTKAGVGIAGVREGFLVWKANIAGEVGVIGDGAHQGSLRNGEDTLSYAGWTDRKSVV